MKRILDEMTAKKARQNEQRIRKFEEEKKSASMVQACELASSILDMSRADIEELLDFDIEVLFKEVIFLEDSKSTFCELMRRLK